MKIQIKLLFLLVVGMFFLSTNLFSQRPQAAKDNPVGGQANKSSFKVSGRVKDASTDEYFEYVNVVILRAKDSSLVNGTITDKDGKFSIDAKKGKYLLRLTFIGYKDDYQPLEIKNEDVQLGVIQLNLGTQALEGVEITAERSMMEYQLDKRVINVDKNIVSAGGNATDVLENVPSVTVDQEGNVSLRGSGNVTVLVDGRPSELLGSDLQTVLEQIPSSTIESVEVITNPSAKYNPEGMSGIINIVLKEKGNRGFNGSIAASTGVGINNDLEEGSPMLFPQASLSAALNYSTKKYAVFLNGDIRYFEMASNGITDKSLKSGVETHQDRYSSGNRLGRGFKIGGDWYINKKNTLSLSYNLRKGGTPPRSESIERLFSKDTNDAYNVNNPNNYFGLETSKRNMLFQNFSVNYEKKFNKKGQILTADANWNIGEFSNDKTQIRSFEEGLTETYFLSNFSKSNNDRAFVNISYVHPFSETLKLEAGYNLNYVNTRANYEYYPTRGITTKDDSMSYVFNYKEAIHAVYGTVGYSFNKKLSAQLGLRLEQVYRDGSKIQTGETLTFPKDPDTKNYFSAYPTLHISYNFTDSQSGQISYSRRVRRPNHWSLAPYVDINNPEYIRFGNPDILPEYTDAFEIGYSKIFQNTTIFTSLYYRMTNNAMTNFSFLWNEANAREFGFDWVWDIAGEEYVDGRIATTSMNLAKSSNYGMEVILDQKITKWWKANLSGNLYGNYEDGREFGGKLVQTLNWDAKLNTTLTLPKNWVVQISGQYVPKRENIQGYSDPMYWFDMSIKKDILNKKGSLGIRVSDIFNTRERSSYTFTENFKQYSVHHRTSRYVVVSFNYRFGVVNKEQTMKERKRQQQQNAGSDDFGGEE